MEVNKDEAERCIQIAIEAFKSGNVERSEKFLRKAENLFPTQRAKGIVLLHQLNNYTIFKITLLQWQIY